MRYIYVALWWAFTLLLAWAVGTHQEHVIVATMPADPEFIVAVEPLPQMPCVNIRRDLRVRDTPELRTYLYGLNPQVCFRRRWVDLWAISY
jgi:hypothetical protein